MTAPVDIAAAVELVETRLGNRGDGFAYREMTRDEEWLLLKAVKSLADERTTVEQRTAEAIAAWLEKPTGTCRCEACDAGDRARRHLADAILSGNWRTP